MNILILNLRGWGEVLSRYCLSSCKKFNWKEWSYQNKDMILLIEGCSHLPTIIIEEWNIDMENISFKNKIDYQIQTFNFWRCGHPFHSNWKAYGFHLLHLIRAINNCSLKNSVKHIDIEAWYIQPNIIKDWSHYYQLRNIEIVGTYDEFTGEEFWINDQN